jgi:hypothetical protein
MYGAREFPASFPSRYAHKPLSFASAPLFFHYVGCVSANVSGKLMQEWCNVSVLSLKIIRRDYARCLTFLRRLFVEIRWDLAVMRINFSLRSYSVTTLSVYNLSVRRHVTYSCLSPGDSGISLHRYVISLTTIFFSDHL